MIITFLSLEFTPRLNISHVVEIILGDRRSKMIKLYRYPSNLISLVIHTSATVLMEDTVRRKKRQFLDGCELRIVFLDELKVNFFLYLSTVQISSLLKKISN